jgi:hypothetical protein
MQQVVAMQDSSILRVR